MAAFPQNTQLAENLIYHSAITGALSGATRMIIKTPVEAYMITTLADNIQGITLSMAGKSAAVNEKVDEARVVEECALIRRETQAILDSIIFCGGGSITEGIIRGFQKGFIDIPF